MVLRRPRRLLGASVLVLLVAISATAAPCASARTMLVGVQDDSVKWLEDTPGLVRIQRDAGFGTVKVSFPWRPGMWHAGRVERFYVARLARMTLMRQHVVVAFGGTAKHTPRTRATRRQFCSYVRSVTASIPGVKDVVIWNEVNSPTFWRPQRNAPREYAALLARCWDVLHAMRSDVNVISSTAPGHDPLGFLRALGDAYAASGRGRPLVDTFGHNPYPRDSTETPMALHEDGYIGQGDYDALVGTLRTSFAGTRQPVQAIWYLEDGFQTRTPFGRPLYFGFENVRALVPALAPAHVLDQEDQLRTALSLAYCSQPLVGAFFNFQLADERRLAGWQSGLLWANWRPKPSSAPLREVAEQIENDALPCG
jgi:hypothetical protein